MSWVSRLDREKGTTDNKAKRITDSVMDLGMPMDDKYNDLKIRVQKEVVSEYNTGFIEGIISPEDKSDVMHLINDVLLRQEEHLTRIEKSRLSQEIFDDVVGLGPLEPFLRDDSISEIMVNDRTHIYVERNGKLEYTGKSFTNDEHILKVINRIVSQVGRR